jgi:hypothetical protein
MEAKITELEQPKVVDVEAGSSRGGAVYGVNLYFIESSVAKYKISKTMTTEDVVKTIIIPETSQQRTTYVERVVTYQENHNINTLMCSNLKVGYRNRASLPSNCCDNQEHEVECYFLSHCWKMPFVSMIEIIKNSHREEQWNEKMMTFKRAHYYYWIDVFCKNQHIPTPAMDEFKSTMIDAGQLLTALWPREPVALTRIWCIYELYCAIDNKLPIHASFVNQDMKIVLNDFQKKPSHHSVRSIGPCEEEEDMFNVHVERADATNKPDIETIMSIINASTGSEKLNLIVSRSFNDTIRRQFDSGNKHLRGQCLVCCCWLVVFGFCSLPIWIMVKFVKFVCGHIHRVDTRF